MKIAFFHNLPTGGGKRSAYEFINELSSEHDIDMFLYDSSSENFLDIRPLVNNTYYTKGDSKNNKTNGVNNFFNRRNIRKLSKELATKIDSSNKYDVVLVMQDKHTNSPYILNFLQTPSVYYCQEPAAKIMEPHYWNNNNLLSPTRLIKKSILSWFNFQDKYSAIKANLICANSMYSCENIYRNYGVHPELVYLGVDPEVFYPKEDIQKEPFILSVGSLNKAKGQDFIIKSVGTLEKKIPIKFIFNFAYGDSSYKDYLNNLALKLGVDISFENLVEDEDLINLYNKASVVAFPSILEPLGLVPLEAQACGTPPVGVSEGGIRETIIHNVTGILTPRDPVKYGQALHKVIRDPVFAQSLAEAGRTNIIENWTWHKRSLTLNSCIKKVGEKE
jgi:glycosyltransferase involved in cell wall biosynthesis